MTRPVQKIVPVVGLVVVGALGALDRAHDVQAAPGPNEVLVVNSAASPARTAIVGAVTATIANTAAEPVPVAVQGTPTVGLSGPVTIGNDDQEAIPVRNLADPARRPWIGGGQMIIDPGETFESEQFISVPPGQVLVVEAVTFQLDVPTGQVAYEGTILGSANGDGEIFRMPLTPLPKVVPAFDRFGTVQRTSINVSGGLVVAASRNSNVGTGIVNVAISGYLVPSNE